MTTTPIRLGVAIQGLDGRPAKQLVPADRVGEFLAVHLWRDEDGDDDGENWVVTHVPTGYRLTGGGNRCRFRNHEAALHFAEELVPLDWDFKDPNKMPKETKEGVLAAIQNALRAQKGGG